MLRSLVPLVLMVGSASAEPSCPVFNNTDHEIGWWSRSPGEWFSIGRGVVPVKDKAGNQDLALTCDAKTTGLKLVGTRGAVTVVRLPDWLTVNLDNDKQQLTVTATKKDAVITLDGAPLALKHGKATALIDVRGKLLASDPRDSYDLDRQGWYVTTAFTATAGGTKAELMLRAPASREGEALLRELISAKTKPVAWAAEPDHAGPAVVAGCGFRGYVPLRNPTRVTAFSLVALCTRTDVKVETCPASTDPYFKNDARVVRYRRDNVIELVEARTGKVVATTTLTGGTPAPCRNTATKPIFGSEASVSSIVDWMNTVK